MGASIPKPGAEPAPKTPLPMKLLLQIAFLARMEARYFAQHTRLLVAAFTIVLVPSIYALIYLSAVWDPEAHTRSLGVAIVNHDEGVHYREHRFNIGQELEARLLASQQFGFRQFTDEEAQDLFGKENTEEKA